MELISKNMISIPEHPEDSTGLERYFPQLELYLNRPENGVATFDWCLITNKVRFSDSYRQLLGLLSDEVQFDNGFLSYVHRDDRKRAAREIHEAAWGHEESFESLYRMQCFHKATQISLIKAEIVRKDDLAIRMHGLTVDVTNIPRLIMRFGSR